MASVQEYKEPKKVKPHSSLQERPLLFGVGMAPLGVVILLLWFAYNIFGLWSVPTASMVVLSGLFCWAIQKARGRDDFAVEGFVLSIFAPARYKAQPHVDDPPARPKASIPSHPPK